MSKVDEFRVPSGLDEYERECIRETHIAHPVDDGYGFPAIDAHTGERLQICVLCSDEYIGNVYFPCPIVRLLDTVEAAHRLLDEWVHATKSQQSDADTSVGRAWSLLGKALDK